MEMLTGVDSAAMLGYMDVRQKVTGLSLLGLKWMFCKLSAMDNSM